MRLAAGCRVLVCVRLHNIDAVLDILATAGSNLQLGHPTPHLATIPQRWRATLILAVHPADAIAGVPQGTELLAPAPDALSEEPPPFQDRASAFWPSTPGGKQASGGERGEMELRPCIATQGLKTGDSRECPVSLLCGQGHKLSLTHLV